MSSRAPSLCALLSGLAIVTHLALPAWSQVVREGVYVTNGAVNTSLIHENTLYIGGTFTRVGPATGSGIPFDAITGSPISGYPKVIGTIETVAPDGTGGWFIGGTFSSVGGIARTNLAHIRADNSVSDWNPGANYTVAAIVVIDGIVYVGGRFTRFAGGEMRNRLAAIDAATGEVTSWDPNANDNVEALTSSGNKLYVGGRFTTVGGQSRISLAAFSLETGALTPWNPGSDGTVHDIEVYGSAVYACGYFHNAGGLPRSCVAALDSSTGMATPWNPAPNGTVRALALRDSTLFVGGDFTFIGGTNRSYLAALDCDTGSTLPWNAIVSVPEWSAGVRALLIMGNVLYAGGHFTSTGGLPRNCLAALDVDTGTTTPWNPDVNHSVHALAAHAGTVYAGGSFTGCGGVTRNYIAALDLATGAVTSWDPNADDWVACLGIYGSTVWAGGYFYRIGGQSRCHIAALDATTGNATSWSRCVGMQRVLALAVTGDLVYVPVSYGIQAFDTATAALVWGTPADNETFALAVGEGRVYAGGDFSTMGGQPHDCLAALDATTGSVIDSWNPGDVAGIDDYVASLVLYGGGILYVGGPFSSVGGQARVGVAAIDAASGVLLPWTANTNAGVRALGLNRDTLYLGGSFTTVAAQPHRYSAAIDLVTGEILPWDPAVDSVVRTFAVGAGNLCLGGDFLGVDRLPQAHVAVLAPVPISVAENHARDDDSLITPVSIDRDRIEIRYVLGSAAPSIHLGIYDVRGRRLRSFPDLVPQRGAHTVLWNGCADSGTHLARGIYLVLLEAGERSVSRKIVVLGD